MFTNVSFEVGVASGKLENISMRWNVLRRNLVTVLNDFISDNALNWLIIRSQFSSHYAIWISQSLHLQRRPTDNRRAKCFSTDVFVRRGRILFRRYPFQQTCLIGLRLVIFANIAQFLHNLLRVELWSFYETSKHPKSKVEMGPHGWGPNGDRLSIDTYTFTLHIALTY